ncbi:MAG: PilZ domain-containing protein [Terriglobales bacterium]
MRKSEKKRVFAAVSATETADGPTALQDDRREAPRMIYRNLRVSFERYSNTPGPRPPDLSTRGMFISTTRVFARGAILEIWFQLAHTQKEIETTGVVRYCLPGVGLGVEFLETTVEQRAAIQRELDIVSRREVEWMG